MHDQPLERRPIPASPLSQAQIGWWGVFQSASLESEFRRHQLENDIEVAKIALGVAAFMAVSFWWTDFRLVESSQTFWILLISRSLLVVTCGLAWKRLRRPIDVDELNRLILSCAILAAMFMVYLTWTRPRDFSGHGVVSASTILLFYIALPLPLSRQCLPAAIISIGNLAIWISIAPTTSSAMVRAFTIAFAFNNAVGFLTSRQLNFWKRRQFIALTDEKTLRSGLEQAMAEIKTLRGILPICAHCKRVRDDVGYWQQVEVYVKDRTHAEFSHGICPDCMRIHFAAVKSTSNG